VESEPRRPWIRIDRDLVIALTSLVVAVSAVAVSVSQTRLMQRQAEAGVWPRLVLDMTQANDSLDVRVRNAGVGPAQIRWGQLRWRDTPVPAVTTILDSVPKPTTGLKARSFWSASLTGNIVSPTGAAVIAAVSGTIAPVLMQAVDEVGLRVCYCSIYEQCWLYSVERLGRDAVERTAPAASCEPRAAVTF
jgi:hypothetical protein